MSSNRINWENFLAPEIVKKNLISSSIYLAAFELLKESIIGRIKTFFIGPVDDDKEYRKEVLSRNGSPLYASLDWLLFMNVIDKEDLLKFENIKNKRNQIAHELPKLLSSQIMPDIAGILEDMLLLLRKIEVWWIKEVDMPFNDINQEEIEENSIMPGPIIALQVIIDIALGEKEKADYYYNQVVKRDKFTH